MVNKIMGMGWLFFWGVGIVLLEQRVPLCALAVLCTRGSQDLF